MVDDAFLIEQMLDALTQLFTLIALFVGDI